MGTRYTWGMLAFAAMCAAPVHAAGGLAAPAPETVWPAWSARLSVQTAVVSPLLNRGWATDFNAATRRQFQGAAILGDYALAQPSIGTFRATGGVLAGSQAGTPMLTARAGQRLGLVVQDATPAMLPGASADPPATVPYLGLGFSRAAAGAAGLSLSADIGIVAGHPGQAAGVGRALLGTQGMEAALRELRLSPMLQLGVRYTF